MQRIVSLVPSLTELLFYLGLNEEVVGITKFCTHPVDHVRGKTAIGGTKNVRVDQVASLAPTLILANKEENTRETVEALQAQFRVLLTDVNTLDEALDMIVHVGEAVDRVPAARGLASQIRESFDALPSLPKLPAAYLIWRDPWMVAARNTFIDEMLSKAGFQNVFAERTRYPVVTDETLRQADPAVVLLSSEPYPFRKQHIAELQAICPRAQVRLVDGAVFSWYGSRLLESAAYFRALRTQCG